MKNTLTTDKTDSTKLSFEGVVVEANAIGCTSKAGKTFTRVTFSAASEDGATTMKFNTFGNVVSKATGGRDLVAGDKVKLTYDVVHANWKGNPRDFNNVAELLEVKNDNLPSCYVTSQITSELEIAISMLRSICDKLAKSCETRADSSQASINDDELPF